MERVWGGRHLESLYGKKLPAGERIGESWEVVDREEAQSVVHTGVLRGKTLNELWSEYRTPVFGARYQGYSGRFPLLVKLLDAAERLSVQVHPPASKAEALQGEPKTEMWYVAAVEPDADLFVGLKKGTTQGDFEAALSEGQVADLLHRLSCQAGDCIFIPSGRVHAIGAGNVIVEVQQNSDTTYRVFDWNRLGLDGKPRQMHVAESMESIDFDDFEPSFQNREPGEPLVECSWFKVEELTPDGPIEAAPAGDFALIVALSGALECAGQTYPPGAFFLVPATLADRTLTPLSPGTKLLRTTLPYSKSSSK